MFGSVLGGLLMFVLGFAFVGAGVHQWVKQRNLNHNCTVQTSGTVSNIRVEIGGGSVGTRGLEKTFYPVFTYTVDGTEYVKRSPYSCGRTQFSIGQAVTVFYDPADPSRFHVVEEKSASNTGPVFTVVGIAIVIFTFVMLFR